MAITGRLEPVHPGGRGESTAGCLRASGTETAWGPRDAEARRMDYADIFSETIMSSLRRWCNSFGENGAPLYLTTLEHSMPVC
jgi:hypothetical protein